jgi:hypothetical protein
MAHPAGPPALASLVRHAERLASLLFIYELTPPTRDPVGRLWLIGRSAEVERFIESVLDDLAARAINEATAVAGLQGYLDGLHVSLVAHFGVTRPACCNPRPPRGNPKATP